MSWRIVILSNPCKLSVRNKQLNIEQLGEEAVRLPLEDLSVIILETKQATLTAYLMAELAEYGIVLFSCDDSHMPSGIFQPFHQHSRYTEMACLQSEWSEPFKKRCWQKIIQEKISNQASVLKMQGCYKPENLDYLVNKVQSGDDTNVEAFASRIYWDSLFDKFRRHDNDKRNSALNYGYGILRGAIARYLSSSGFIPCFGVHHCNKLNAFNLADDMIEPFRPFVDNIVFSLFEDYFDDEEIGLNIDERQELVAVLTNECIFDKEKINVLKACELAVNSLSRATRQKNYNILEFPKLITGKGTK